MWDVAIVGSGPAGASCAAFCAAAGLRTLVLERAIFPREKVCGDCLNPTVLAGAASGSEWRPKCARRRTGNLARVDFIAVDRRTVSAPLPAGEQAEIAIRRSVLDEILRRRARIVRRGSARRRDAGVRASGKTTSGPW